MPITKPGADVFAPTDATGAARRPVLGDAQTWAIEVEGNLAALETAFAVSEAIWSTRAGLYADLTPAAPATAWVVFDPTPAYNGIYAKSGASGSGSWARVAPLPYGVIPATQTGGTTSTIHAQADGVAVTTEALIVVALTTTNAASPMFISFNGGTTSYRVKTSGGSDVSVGGLVGPGAMLGKIAGVEFKLFSDQSSNAIQLAAAASAAAAEAARDLTESYLADTASYAAMAFDASVGVARPAEVTGYVGTRGLIPSGFSTTDKQMMSASTHVMRSPSGALQLVFANWYVSATSVETNGPGSITVKASIEYPSGTFTPVTWSGGGSIVIAAGATAVPSDTVKAPPEGARFRVHSWQEGASGIVYADVKNPIGGDACEHAASGLTDKTLSGTITDDGATTIFYGPSAIIGPTTKPSVLIVGDSRQAANGSLLHNDSDSNKGNIAHALGPHFGYVQASRSARTMAQFISSHSKQVALATWATHVVIQIGINDLSGGASGATALSRLGTIIGYFPGKQSFPATIEPWPSSTDLWVTVENQTPAAWDAERVIFNDGIRAGIPGATGYFEFADGVESERNSGVWRIHRVGVAPTSDGVHINDAGHRDIDRLQAIDPRRIYAYPELTRSVALRADVDDATGGGRLVTVGALNRNRLTASRSTDQTGILAGTSTTVIWDTFEGVGITKWTPATGRIYPPQGWYWVSAQVEIQGAIDNQLSFIRLQLTDIKVAEASMRTSNTSNYTLSVTRYLYFDGVIDNLRVTVNTTGSETTVSAGVSQSCLQIVGN